MDGDAEAQYTRALDITLQWLDAWKLSGSARDLATAKACSQIARERFARLQRARVAHRDYTRLILIEKQAEMDAVVDEIRDTIAQCRELFEQINETPKAAE